MTEGDPTNPIAIDTSQLATAKKRSKNLFELRVTNRSSLIPWILSHKTDVEVLCPQEIRDEIRKILRKIL